MNKCIYANIALFDNRYIYANILYFETVTTADRHRNAGERREL